MANKEDSGNFSKSKSMRELDDALQRSFSNIKNDMTALKESLHQQGVKLTEATGALKESRSDFVTVDKFNIIKIKLGELNEGMKKVWDIEKKLEDVDRKSVTATDFDKQTSELENDIAKLKADVKDLNKAAATEAQMKDLASDINEEFDKVKKGIEELRLIKDTITKTELEKRSDTLDKKAKEVRDDFEKVRAEVKSKVTVTQVEALVADINKEFDSIKATIAAVKQGEQRFALTTEVEKDLAKIEKRADEVISNTTVAVDQFSKGVETMFKDLARANAKQHDNLAHEIDSLKESSSKKISEIKDELSEEIVEVHDAQKKLVTRTQVEALVEEINKEFDGMKAQADKSSKALAAIDKESATRSELASEVSRLKGMLDKMSKDISVLRKESATKEDAHGIFESLKEMIVDTNVALKEKFESLVKLVKKESDIAHKRIGENSQDIEIVEKDLKKDMKELVAEDDLHGELDVIKDEFERLHKDIKVLQENMLEAGDLEGVSNALGDHITMTKKDFVSRKQFEKLASNVDRLTEQLELQTMLIAEKEKEVKVYSKELKAAKKAEKKLAKLEEAELRAQEKEMRLSENNKGKGAKEYHKSGVFANFLIGAAFVVLIAAIGFFFAGLTGLTDTLSIAAVVCFVVGIIIRIVIGFKTNGN